MEEHEEPQERETFAVDEEEIRQRAFEISLRADGGSPEENWRRAREELLDERSVFAS